MEQFAPGSYLERLIVERGEFLNSPPSATTGRRKPDEPQSTGGQGPL